MVEIKLNPREVYNSRPGTTGTVHVIPVFATNIFNSQWIRADDMRRITGFVLSNQASVASGFIIQQSNDESNADYTTSYTVAASTVLAFDVVIVGRYVRFHYEHAGVEPTVWRACAYLKAT